MSLVHHHEHDTAVGYAHRISTAVSEVIIWYETYVLE